MSMEQNDRAIAVRWLEGLWGHAWNLKTVDELAADDISLQFSLQTPRRGADETKRFLLAFRDVFPDLEFRQVGDLISDGEYIYGRFEGGGTHTGPAFLDYLVGFFPAHSGKRIDLAATITLRIKSGKIAEDVTRVAWSIEPRRFQKSAA
jgi:predicted ester cyclase